MKCEHENITHYEEGFRCITCFEQFTPTAELDKMREEIAELILEEFNSYAPDQPPVSLQTFIDALMEVTRDVQ